MTEDVEARGPTATGLHARALAATAATDVLGPCVRDDREARLAQLVTAQSQYEEFATRRQDAIMAALKAGNSLRAVAEAAACSYESVRRWQANRRPCAAA